MPATYLLINAISYPYLTLAADYIADALRRHSTHSTRVAICNTIAEARVEPGSAVFVIGDPFYDFPKPPGCKFVFINFSLLRAMGPTKRYSQAARNWINKKAAALAAKARAFDYILDVYPEQAPLLQAVHGVPVLPFKLGIAPFARPTSAPLYDVCVVGGLSPRRMVLIERLRRLGLNLSPTYGVVLEEIAARSKTVLNVQALRSLNVEMPRVIGALLSGATLVCETSEPLAHSVPPDLYRQADYRHLAGEIMSAVSAYNGPDTRAADWVRSVHLPACDRAWRRIIETVEGH
jgi:hypothetical protein